MKYLISQTINQISSPVSCNKILVKMKRQDNYENLKICESIPSLQIITYSNFLIL